ncbi:hypothetical protein LQF61_12515, partial [Tetragenococcus koreensis]
LVFVDYYSTGELTCFLFSETKKDASDFSPTSYIIEPFIRLALTSINFTLSSPVYAFHDLKKTTLSTKSVMISSTSYYNNFFEIIILISNPVKNIIISVFLFTKKPAK